MKRTTSKNYSVPAMNWLNFVEHAENISIKHAENGGEVVIEDPELVTEKTKKPKKYIVDGFCEETNTIYEYYGDFVHGNILINKSALFQNRHACTKERENRLKELGFNVVIMWNSDWIKISEAMML